VWTITTGCQTARLLDKKKFGIKIVQEL